MNAQDKRLAIVVGGMCSWGGCEWPRCTAGCPTTALDEKKARGTLRRLDAHDKAERAAQPVTDEMVKAGVETYYTHPRSIDGAMRSILTAALRAAPAAPHSYPTSRGYGAEGAGRAARPMSPTPPEEEAENAKARPEFARVMDANPGEVAKLDSAVRAQRHAFRQRELDAEAARAAADVSGNRLFDPKIREFFVAISNALHHRSENADGPG